MIKYTVFTELTGKHTLIAGSTGSGKSVVENGIIYNLLFDTPNVQFIFIDLKRVELAEYKRLPQCIQYADTLETATAALQATLKEIDKRYKWMQKRSVKTFNGSSVYLVIDELADLMTVDRKTITPLLRRILQHFDRLCRFQVSFCDAFWGFSCTDWSSWSNHDLLLVSIMLKILLPKDADDGI